MEPPWLEIGGRIFPVDDVSGLADGVVLATLTADDGYAGVALTDVANGDVADGESACGGPAGAVFDFDRLAEGMCARDDVVGLRVALDVHVEGG